LAALSFDVSVKYENEKYNWNLKKIKNYLVQYGNTSVLQS
jgi:hypothetical protein